MTDVLARLAPPVGARHKERRKGRGPGSTQGKQAGKGSKGQKARHGGNFSKLHFQGGQTPIQRRLPKRGFRVPFPIEVVAINVAMLERFESGANVNEELLRASRLVQGRNVQIKFLGDGELTKKLNVSAHKFSQSAREKIEKAGGTVTVIELHSSADAAPQA